MNQLRWGILGTGNIAHQFANGVAGARRGRVVAVGSRAGASAEAFAREFDLPRAHGSYEALLADGDVDAVYISLPNSMHCDWTIRALEAGKHVLCEKPIAASAAEAERMFDAAQRHGRVLVEALMYRSHPLTQAVMQHIHDGAIGQLKLIRASFCFRTTRTNAGENIRFDANLAGGALMDIGCYCLSLARLVAGEAPVEAQGMTHLHDSGVDDYAVGTLRFGSGLLATFACGMTVQANNTAFVCGDEGYIEIPVPWKPPQTGARYTIGTMTPPRQDSAGQGMPPRREHTVDAPLPLYGLEADDFAATVLDGAPPVVTAEESIDNMRLLDALREPQSSGRVW
ncbi:MAG: Gfo/Idh/MocA family protein [Phycisphaeraceae bacterium]